MGMTWYGDTSRNSDPLCDVNPCSLLEETVEKQLPGSLDAMALLWDDSNEFEQSHTNKTNYSEKFEYADLSQ